jgi:hypothetical protein
MTSATNMISRLNTIQCQFYGYSLDEVIKIEQLALLDCILEELRQLKMQIALLKGVKE